MKRGWIRLWRKTTDNIIFQRDPTAWHIFEVLLLVCDRNNGNWEGGRFQLAELVKQKPTTTYKAIKRLENAKMVTLTSNNKYTSIQICKWKEYQANGNTSREQQSNNKVTTKGHSYKNVRIRELKNQKERYKNIVSKLAESKTIK